MLDPPKLSISLAGLPRIAGALWSGGPKAAIRFASGIGAGVRGVTLDATAPGVRPRELDRGARRDLGAAIRRLGLEFAGLDVFIPPEHFADDATSDRAVGAVLAAAALAGDLADLAGAVSSRVISLTFPGSLNEGVASAMGAEVARLGVRLADHACPPIGPDASGGLAVGVDPAAAIIAGQSPAKGAVVAGDRLAAARLSDLSHAGRCPVGASGSRLDLTAYAAALATVGLGCVSIDLRGLADPESAARTAADAWAAALTLPGA